MTEEFMNIALKHEISPGITVRKKWFMVKTSWSGQLGHNPIRKNNLKKILLCVAHSDDETIGCAGTIARHVNNGDKVYGLYFTNGVGARNNKNLKAVNERIKSAKKPLKFWVLNG